MFQSPCKQVGTLEFPEFKGVRVMMMPILLNDLTSLPDAVNQTPLSQWKNAMAQLFDWAPVDKGVAYLTIDEKFVRRGNTHRRPGLHVDGIGDTGGSLGGYGGGYGGNGMLLGATVTGCKAWKQEFLGYPEANGDCANLKEELREDCAEILNPGEIYFFTGLTVHEGLPMKSDCYRQFVRLSMPSEAPWHRGYTENPLGIKPAGAIVAPRPQAFMQGRNI